MILLYNGPCLIFLILYVQYWSMNHYALKNMELKEYEVFKPIENIWRRKKRMMVVTNRMFRNFLVQFLKNFILQKRKKRRSIFTGASKYIQEIWQFNLQLKYGEIKVCLILSEQTDLVTFCKNLFLLLQGIFFESPFLLCFKKIIDFLLSDRFIRLPYVLEYQRGDQKV